MSGSEPIWTDQQEAFFRWCAVGQGNRILRARAGCGKTRSILEGARRAPERRVLLCAFNRPIVRELNTRIVQEDMGYGRRVEAMTLHALGHSYLRGLGWFHDQSRGRRIAREVIDIDHRKEREGELPARYRPLLSGEWGAEDDDPLRLKNVAREVARFASLLKQGLPLGCTALEAVKLISRTRMIVDEEVMLRGWKLARILAHAMQAVGAALVPDGTFDHDDSLFMPVAAGYATPRYELIMVDECADMNRAQIELALRSLRPGGRACVVGDNRQAIYSWRGADSEALERLQEALSADVLELTVTWRCPKAVVDLARKLVPDLEARPGAPEGLVERVHDLFASSAPPGIGDFILSRVNAALVPTCLSLIKRKIPAVIAGRSFADGLIKAVRACVPKRKRPEDVEVEDWLEAFTRRQSRRRMKVIKASKGKREGDPSLHRKLEAIKDEEEALTALCEADDILTAADLERKLRELYPDPDDDTEADIPAVRCSSVHRCKGLQAKNVFILMDTLYIYGRRRASLEEENLHYVALTRAMERLVLVGVIPDVKQVVEFPMSEEDERRIAERVEHILRGEDDE